MAGPRAGRAEAVSVRLLRLEARLARAERQLRAALALRGRLQALERRLESGGGGGALGMAARGGQTGSGSREAGRCREPLVPVNLEDVWMHFSEREWRALRGWQRALHRAVLRSNRRALRAPEDSTVHIKQEEELCSADLQEGEAGEAPEEPCPKETFYEPEAPSQARSSQEVDPRELPGTESQDLPRDPDTGFQAYATDVLSWIKQEEESRCPEQDLEKEEISADSSTVHDANPKRDPLADAFESRVGDSEPAGRPAEKFSKDPSPGMTWDAQWNPEMMETSSTGSGLGGEAGHERGFAEPLDFFSAQENSVGKRPGASVKCEGHSSQQEHLHTAQRAREGEVFPGLSCERNPSERLFQPPPGAPAGQDTEPGAAPGPCQGLPQPAGRAHNPAGGCRLREPAGEEQPSAESEENLPVEKPLGSPCWDPADRAPGCGQSQPRGKSYICSDCGKSFVCHSWLVRHQMTHTGERPYKCSECDKSYRRKDYLLNHQRRHSGEGLFQCPLCRKRFVLRRSFLKHQESHVQETPLGLASWPCTEIRGSIMHSI
ncbi:zinc finger protein 282-like [Apus apus]|uniref:zinc finger protein 282-like n=1 Tax=Apus apus TaxID=8895 RepID=UPI0021F89276|nr:zinc finger protein 282-like [Apus apus]